MTPTQSAAVITMVQAADFPAAWSSLRSIEPQLGRRVHRFVLINDARDAVLEDELAASPFTTVITPGTNLGVARGRNRLLSESLQCGAEMIISVDDDILLPGDYISTVLNRYRELQNDGERVGIVGPVVFDFRALAAVAMTPGEAAAAEQGQTRTVPMMEELRRRMAAAWPRGAPEAAIYHAGIRGWQGNYLRFNGGLAGEVRQLMDDALEGPRLPALPTYELKRDPAILRSLLRDHPDAVPVDTLPGGVSVFSADLLQTVGLLDESFSPFGYEDADFAIRAIKSRYQNYLLPELVVLHDLGSRGKERDLHAKLFVEGRSRALLARKHVEEGDRSRMAFEAILLAPLRTWDLARTGVSADRCPEAAYLAGLVGYVAGWVDGTTAVGVGDDEPLRPGRIDRTWPLTLDVWSGSPQGGLPQRLRGTVSLTLTWVPERGELTIERFELDFPGHGRLHASLRVVDLEGTAEPTRDGYRSASIETMTLEFRDRDLLRRLENTVAWRRRERSTGYLSGLARAVVGARGRALRWFLSPIDRRPATVRVSVAPNLPTSTEHLASAAANEPEGNSCNDLSLKLEVESAGLGSAADRAEAART